MKLADGTNLMDLGVTPPCVWTVPAVMPWYRLFQDGNPSAMDVALTPDQRRELHEDGCLLLDILSYAYKMTASGGRTYLYAQKVKIALVLGVEPGTEAA